MADEQGSIKRCSKCSETKPVTAFGRQAIRKDGLNPWCRQCKKAAGANYYERNRDDCLARDKAYVAAHREESNEKARRWRRVNPERSAAISAAYSQRNPEKRRLWSLNDYYKNHEIRRLANRSRWRANRERYGTAAARWRLQNKDVKREHARNYKAKKRNALGTHTQSDVLRIFSAQRGRCAYCPKMLRLGFHVDHIIPLSEGGTNFPNNIQLTCPFCNLSKKNKSPLVFARSLGRLL